jgi:uncharacterized membrane protein YecN with MAPEG domain
MIFTVTPIYALPLALIYLILWVRISAIRAGTKISFGDGGNVELLRRIRRRIHFSNDFNDSETFLTFLAIPCRNLRGGCVLDAGPSGNPAGGRN